MGNPRETMQASEEKEEKRKERLPAIEKIRNMNSGIVEILINKYGLPIKKNGKLDEKAFAGKAFSKEEVESDLKKVDSLKQKFGEEVDIDDEKRVKSKSGEWLEIVTNIELFKLVGDKYIVVRSSNYDDIVGGTDNFVVNKKTGKVVCVLDEVGDMSGARYEEKKKKVMRKNKAGGVHLKYGFKVSGDGDNLKIELGEIKNAPLAYVALDEKYIEKTMDEINPSFEKMSDHEIKFGEYLVSALDYQSKIEKLEEDIDQELISDLDGFINDLRDGLEKNKNNLG